MFNITVEVIDVNDPNPGGVTIAIYNETLDLEFNGTLIKTGTSIAIIQPCEPKFQGWIEFLAPEVRDISKVSLNVGLFDSKGIQYHDREIEIDIIPNKKIRQTFTHRVTCSGFEEPNFIAGISVEAAYRHCEDWLDELLVYIGENLNFLRSFLEEKMPEVKLIEPEGTYLVWLDFSEWNLSHKQLEDFMVNKAGVALDEGYIFGQGGEGFERINLACPRALLKEGLERILKKREFTTINH